MKLKRFLLPILALAVIVTAMAFTLPGKSNTKTTVKSTKSNTLAYYFKYIGPSPAFSFSDYTNPANYVLVPDDQNPYELCEYGNDTVCFIICEGAYYMGVFRPDFAYNPGYGSAYWGLYNLYNYGYSGTSAVELRPY